MSMCSAASHFTCSLVASRRKCRKFRSRIGPALTIAFTAMHASGGSRRQGSRGGSLVECAGCGDGICSRLAFTFLLAAIGSVGCAGGFPNSNPQLPPTQIAVSPSSTIVAAGSNTSFIAVFTPILPEGGSLTWSVNAATAGTITSAGVYTASETPGTYTIVATWTATNLAAGINLSGSAAVQVLPVPQVDAALNADLAQASGGTRVSGSGSARVSGSGGMVVSQTVQDTAIVGQRFPFMTFSDPSGNVQLQPGLTIPVVCGGPRSICQ